MATEIQWTDDTDNIIVAVDEAGERRGWWCKKISPGCALCYAEGINLSTYFHGNLRKYTGEPPVLKLREDIIDGWARQRKPKKHFVASMTDVFGEWVPQFWIFRFMDGMRAATRQIFQVLTKRAANMRVQVLAWLKARNLERVPENIWLGVSVEDQERADERLPELLRIPSVHFVSVEPLLDAVDLDAIQIPGERSGLRFSSLREHHDDRFGSSREILDWVIVGGESDKKGRARRTAVAQVRVVVRQCVEAGVAVFVKQLGAKPVPDVEDYGVAPHRVGAHWPDGVTIAGDRIFLRHRKGSDPLEWPEELRVRQFPFQEAAAA